MARPYSNVQWHLHSVTQLLESALLLETDVGPACGVHSEQSSFVCSAAWADPQFQDIMVIVRQQLAAKGAGPDIQTYVEQLMLERHETYKMYATAEADKRRHLLDHVSRLEVSNAAHCVSGSFHTESSFTVAH